MMDTMPSITRVQKRQQALPGPLRFTVEGGIGAWPGDNPNQCSQGYNCPVCICFNSGVFVTLTALYSHLVFQLSALILLFQTATSKSPQEDQMHLPGRQQ